MSQHLGARLLARGQRYVGSRRRRATDQQTPTEAPANREALGHDLWAVLSQSEKWMHRMVYSLSCLEDGSTRVSISYDVSLDVLFQTDESSNNLFLYVPVGFPKKENLISFDARNADGKSMAILGKSDNIRMHAQFLQAAADRLLPAEVGRCPETLDLIDYVVNTSGDGQDRFEIKLAEWIERSIKDNNRADLPGDLAQFIYYMTRAHQHFMLVLLVPAETARGRTVLKTSFDVNLPASPYGRFTVFVPDYGMAKSVHVEVTLPAGVEGGYAYLQEDAVKLRSGSPDVMTLRSSTSSYEVERQATTELDKAWGGRLSFSRRIHVSREPSGNMGEMKLHFHMALQRTGDSKVLGALSLTVATGACVAAYQIFSWFRGRTLWPGFEFPYPSFLAKDLIKVGDIDPGSISLVALIPVIFISFINWGPEHYVRKDLRKHRDHISLLSMAAVILAALLISVRLPDPVQLLGGVVFLLLGLAIFASALLEKARSFRWKRLQANLSKHQSGKSDKSLVELLDQAYT